MKLTVSNWISIMGIAIPVVISSLSLLWTNYRNSQKRDEELRPNVFITYERGWEDGFYAEKMILKNYGMTNAMIKEVEITPLITNQSGKDLMANTFASIKNLPLAPQQEIKTVIGSEGILINRKNRHFVIKYTNTFFKKEYVADYWIDETQFPTIMNIGKGMKKIEIKIDSTQFKDLKKG